MEDAKAERRVGASSIIRLENETLAEVRAVREDIGRIRTRLAVVISDVKMLKNFMYGLVALVGSGFVAAIFNLLHK